MDQRSYLVNGTIKGSTKVQGYERAVTLTAVGPCLVRNDFEATRAQKRHSGEPNFAPVYVQAPLGKDTVESLNSLAAGTNIKAVEITTVQSTGQDHQAMHNISIGKDNGATYVDFWSVYGDVDAGDADDPGSKGLGVLVTYNLQGNSMSTTFSEVSQNQQASGKVVAQFSRLNQTAGA